MDISIENEIQSRTKQRCKGYGLFEELKKVLHPTLVFSNANVSQFKSQKHLGNILDSKLKFEDHY